MPGEQGVVIRTKSLFIRKDLRYKIRIPLLHTSVHNLLCSSCPDGFASIYIIYSKEVIFYAQIYGQIAFLSVGNEEPVPSGALCHAGGCCHRSWLSFHLGRQLHQNRFLRNPQPTGSCSLRSGDCRDLWRHYGYCQVHLKAHRSLLSRLYHKCSTWWYHLWFLLLCSHGVKAKNKLLADSHRRSFCCGLCEYSVRNLLAQYSLRKRVSCPASRPCLEKCDHDSHQQSHFLYGLQLPVTVIPQIFASRLKIYGLRSLLFCERNPFLFFPLPLSEGNVQIHVSINSGHGSLVCILPDGKGVREINF